MHAELRHEYGDRWSLEIVGVRGGRQAWFFGEGIEAPPGRERELATARLGLAGYQVRGWSEVDGGWDGDLS